MGKRYLGHFRRCTEPRNPDKEIVLASVVNEAGMITAESNAIPKYGILRYFNYAAKHFFGRLCWFLAKRGRAKEADLFL